MAHQSWRACDDEARVVENHLHIDVLHVLDTSPNREGHKLSDRVLEQGSLVPRLAHI